LCYPLAVASISEAAAAGITKKLFPNLAPTVHTPLLSAMPPALFGLGLPNLYWEQGTVALCLFLEVSNGHSADSHLFYCFLEQTQLELGIATPFFQAD